MITLKVCIQESEKLYVILAFLTRPCRLWHQLSVALEEFLSNPSNSREDNFYNVSNVKGGAVFVIICL